LAFEDKEGRLHILESGGRFGTLPSEVRTSRLCTGAGEGGDTTEERRGALPSEEAEEKDEEDGEEEEEEEGEVEGEGEQCQ